MKLSDEEGLYRIRSGDYRIIHQIRDRVLLILVVSVGHRSNIYRR
jgi:mRNA interferase RelE/StbE